jgi:precorrin-2 dehydrogenase/sirohydrochlorin ferrochelatase
MGQPGYAILLDVIDRQNVVVGGGATATRKVRGLLAAGATRVRVISPEFHPQMPDAIERIQAEFRAEHLAGAKLVIAATNKPQVNEAVVREASRIGALVSRIDSHGEDHGDFILPAVWQEGNLSVAVSTRHAPALARLIRDSIGEWIDPRWVAMTDAMTGVRPVVMQGNLSTDRRREIFQSLLSDDALETAAQEGTSGVLHWLAGRFPDLGLPPAKMREKEEM